MNKVNVKKFSDFFGLNHINHIAIAIDKYKVIQTGAKIQSGGLNEDLTIEEYQGSL